MENRNSSVDIAKYISAIMIVAIHTGLFSDTNEIISFVVVNILCRTAVPFFAICTGYFLSTSMEFGKKLFQSDKNKQVIIKQWKKLAVLYSIWTVLYMFFSIPMWIRIGWFSPFAFVDYAIGAVTKGSHYHFWYLWGMIYTLPIFYFLLCHFQRKTLLTFTILLWLAKAITYGYTIILPNSQIISLLQEIGTLLCLLPLLLLGALIARSEKRNLHHIIVGFILSLFCLFAEAFFLKQIGQNAFSYILFTLPVGYFLFQLLISINIPFPGVISRKLGEASLFIYCIHPMFVELTGSVIHSSMLHFCFSAFASTACAFLFQFFKSKVYRKKEL